MLACLSAALPVTRARASHVELAAGLAQPGLNPAEQPWAVGTAFRLGYLRPFSERWSFTAAGTYHRFQNDTSSNSTIKLNFSNDHADQRWQLLAVDLGAQYDFAAGQAFVPYARGSVGVSFWNVQYLNGDPVEVTTASGAPSEFSAQELTLRGALGVTYPASAAVGLSLEVEGSYLTGLGADFSEATDQSRSRAVATLLFKVSFDLGQGSGDVQITTASPATVPAAASPAQADSDQDGVPDVADRCPSTPAAARGWVDVEGCPIDSDRDGVPDYRDRCAHSDSRWPVDTSGCAADSDSDGVADAADACPGTAPGLRVNNAGCPEYPALQDTVVLRFEYPPGGTQLDAEAQATLQELVPAILYNPAVQIAICGYTDDAGDSQSNFELSQQRAQVVKDFLVAEGIPASQLVATGQGESRPIAPNDTPEGRALNRRIELVPVRR